MYVCMLAGFLTEICPVGYMPISVCMMKCPIAILLNFTVTSAQKYQPVIGTVWVGQESIECYYTEEIIVSHFPQEDACMAG